MAFSVNISVEAPIENQIQEITYDGQEIYQAPLTLSENLAKIAQRIDFSKTSTSGSDDTSTDKVENGEKSDKQDSKDSFAQQNSLWPWDSVRSKLRNALTEVCVFADVLAIAKEKRYLVLDPVPQDPPEVKPMVQVYARKKALAGAANVTKAEDDEKVPSSSPPVSPNPSASPAASTALGGPGTSSVPSVSSPIAPPATSTQSSSSKSSSLRVTIPSELQGVAYIKVLCQKDQEDLCSSNINLLTATVPNTNADMHWQQKLEAAQNVLFCKELFSQLAREAVHLRAPIPHMVVGNQIMATVLPGIQLIIGLCHGTGNEKKPASSSPPPVHNAEHDHVLEHSLHQLLREVHHKNTHHPFPHPSSGPLGPSKRRRIAGPTAADRYELLEMTKSQTILEQIIQQAQHFFMRVRTEYVLDTIAKEVKDPLIVSHWNALNSPTQSCVKINIWTNSYDTVCRTSLVVHVGEKSLKCVCRDGRVMNMSYEPQELRDLIFCQIHQHQITAVQNLAKCMGWQFLANSSHLGLGAVEPLGNASSCILASPIGDRMIAVRCEPQSGVQVSIAHSPRKDFFPGQLVRERKWENLGGSFKEVRWKDMEGKNFCNKMELLMASLTSSQN
ncbi:hypothetical protein G9C98_005552 [Cotesia typhae]|uniref:Mediator of RNA polymerase II transcription subunit 17 n=1 Tax=Cotesia typhae TaxID=2053667 RepID=A0A8J5QZ25_9HYME|nr:hypothetical protein G9C98_005552 [Cotesia typhae]